MSTMRVVIVEDEPLACDLLRSYIAMHADLELVGEARSGRDGLVLVEQQRPDLVLLDIQMPELTGLALASALRYDPAIVFITAYDSHALVAFELGAFDYLLKPVLPERFSVALHRVRERRNARLADAQELGSALRLSNVLGTGFLERFFVRRLGQLIPIRVKDVVRLQADDDYTAIYANGQCSLVHLSLRDLAARLDPKMFVRVHRSAIINLAHVRSGEPDGRRMTLRMSDGSTVIASRAGKHSLNSLSL